MQLINILGVVFIIKLAVTASASHYNKDDKHLVPPDPLRNEHVLYTSEYDIVSITVPLNSVNFDNDMDDSDTGIELYFVEADINNKGQKEYKGLYCLKNGKATKILETGTGVSVANDGTEKVYISAKDGIYCFETKTNKIEKYGTVTDSLIDIDKTNGSDVLYVLTEDHDVYKVTDNGNKKEKLQDVKDAQQIVLDYSNNLYFYNKDKVPFVVTEKGVNKIVGIPENLTYGQLIKHSAFVKNGVIFVADDKLYIVFVNGTNKATDITLPLKPTAYAPEANIIQYYGYNKNIYERNYLQSDLRYITKFGIHKYLIVHCAAKTSRNEWITYVDSRLF